MWAESDTGIGQVVAVLQLLVTYGDISSNANSLITAIL